MTALIALIAVWFFTGWLGWRLVIIWWTEDLDMTRKDQRSLRPAILLGPANLIAGVLCYIEVLADRRDLSRTSPDNSDIIYPRKELT